MKQTYTVKSFKNRSLTVIGQMNAICAEYAAQGFTLTVRQLFYQLVSRDLLANNQQEYKRVVSIAADARMAGLLDWDYLEDRTRNVRELPHWTSPRQIMRAVADQYQTDLWRGQEFRPFVLIEKDALVGVIEGVCSENDVPYLSCRGYTSISELRSLGVRLLTLMRKGKHQQTPVILHLGDHDPSGIDMTRDITDRLEVFTGGVEVKRLALNYDQIEQYTPPPNFAKETDSRFIGYQEVYGEECWELDALSPTTISDLIGAAIDQVRDPELWETAVAERDAERARLRRIADQWSDVVQYIGEES